MIQADDIKNYILNEEISVRIVQTPAGDMALAADEKKLLSCFYRSSQPGKIKEKGSDTMQLQLAGDFFIGYMTDPLCEIQFFLKKGLVLDFSQYTNKEKSVYTHLLDVGPGRTVTYGELAQKCSMPRAGRFVGNAMAANRFPVIVPCHRVIKADYRIGRYTGGDEKKALLLRHEGVQFKDKKVVKS